jgi:hypothetical protein
MLTKADLRRAEPIAKFIVEAIAKAKVEAIAEGMAKGMARGLRRLVAKGCLTMEEGKDDLNAMAQDGLISEAELKMTLSLLGSE